VTPLTYWTLWTCAGLVFLSALMVILHVVVTVPIVRAIEGLR
jgi:hypothetical protein